MSTSSSKPITRVFQAGRRSSASNAARAAKAAKAAKAAQAAGATIPTAHAQAAPVPVSPAGATPLPHAPDDGVAAQNASPPVPDVVLKERRKTVRHIPVPEVVESESESDWAAFQELASEPPASPPAAADAGPGQG